MRSRLVAPPESPGAIWGSPADLDTDLDTAFATLAVVEELMRPEPRCDAVVTIGGHRFFLVKSFKIRE